MRRIVTWMRCTELNHNLNAPRTCGVLRSTAEYVPPRSVARCGWAGTFPPLRPWHTRAALPRPRDRSEVPVSGGQPGVEASPVNRHKLHVHCKLCPDVLSSTRCRQRPVRARLRAWRVAQNRSENLPLCATLYRQASPFFPVPGRSVPAHLLCYLGQPLPLRTTGLANMAHQ